MYTWDDRFSVHHPLMDEQHKVILSLINELDSFTGDESKEIITSFLKRLVDFIHEHFTAEEDLIRSLGDKVNSISHILYHNKMRQKITNVLIDQLEGKACNPLGLQKYLIDWWEYHIMVEDMKYARILKTRLQNK
jgi:hemerythrin